MPKRLPAPQIRRSHISATSSPPPTHTPWIIATVGCGHSPIERIVAWISSPYFLPCAALARTSGNSAISAPAANAFVPAPRTMTQRRLSSAESSRMRVPRSVHEASDMALSLSGRSSTTVAMAPSRSTRTAAVMASLVEEVDESHADKGYVGHQNKHGQQHGDE